MFLVAITDVSLVADLGGDPLVTAAYEFIESLTAGYGTSQPSGGVAAMAAVSARVRASSLTGSSNSRSSTLSAWSRGEARERWPL